MTVGPFFARSRFRILGRKGSASADPLLTPDSSVTSGAIAGGGGAIGMNHPSVGVYENGNEMVVIMSSSIPCVNACKRRTKVFSLEFEELEEVRRWRGPSTDFPRFFR